MDAVASRFEELASTLPPRDSNTQDPDQGARATLWLLLQNPLPLTRPSGTGRASKVVSPGTHNQDPNTCPNCDVPATSTRTPYCSDLCKEMSAFIRQFRNSLNTGVALTAERQVMLGEKLWHLLGGGYPRRQAMAPKASLKQVWKREDGKCQICGEPADTIDHTGSG